tara:strand:+ start:535 stop:1806 length:1272 start_codon:yes stop_codon:yes gene_type:complete
MTVVTSKISPVQIGQGRNKETIYTATRTTKLGDGTYSVDMLQYSNAQGQGGRVIATRESVNNWKFNDQASGKVKQNEGRLNEASKTQMESMRGDFVTKSQETEEYNRAQGQPNKATNDNESADTAPAAASSGADLGSAAAGTREQFPNCRYPIDIGNLTMDVMKFDMYKYVPGQFSAAKFGFDTSGRQSGNRSSIGTVVLPVTGGISDQNKCDWGSSSMSILDIAKANIAKDAIFNGLGEGVETAMNEIKKVFEHSAEAKLAVGTAMAASAAGVEGLLTRTTGNVFNPNMELLFKGPALRPFSFKFKLTPRSAEESKEVIKIIRFFKQGMAPIRSQSNLFLKSPHTFRIAYLHRGENGELHRGLNMFKEVALQGFGVNYTPNGNYATYSDGIPVAYEISMTFTELEPVFNDDYPNDNDASIGF